MANEATDLENGMLQMLGKAAVVAIGIGDVGAFNTNMDQLDLLSQNNKVSTDCMQAAGQLHDKLAQAAIDASIDKMSAIVETLGDATGGLKAAIVVAKNGANDLAIPAVAKAASTALTSFESVDKSFTAVKTDLEKLKTSDGFADVAKELAAFNLDIRALRKSLTG